MTSGFSLAVEVLVSAEALTTTDTSDNGGSGWIRTNDPRLIKTVL